MIDERQVVLDRHGDIGCITLRRPEKRNAMTGAMRKAFGECVAAADADASIRIVLLRGEGPDFCAGADLIDAPDDAMAWRERVRAAQAHHLALVRMQKPVIAAVQGRAVGGGASIALAADILLMADDARLVFPFVRLGVVPDGGASALLQAKAGPAAALDLLLTGGSLSAVDALQAGVTRRVVPAARLHDAADALANELLALPAEALMLTKALCAQHWAAGLERVLDHEAEAFALATTTHGHQRAITALRETLRRQA
jgi:2-(1,2-epoxy-1,2-dihydrophenyl)acetyl-CoA isomerase